jgi:AcrR family transcriptional regulator
MRLSREGFAGFIDVLVLADEAGQSLRTLYQYFASKDDVCRHLAAQVARQLSASTIGVSARRCPSPGRTSVINSAKSY